MSIFVARQAFWIALSCFIFEGSFPLIFVKYQTTTHLARGSPHRFKGVAGQSLYYDACMLAFLWRLSSFNGMATCPFYFIWGRVICYSRLRWRTQRYLCCRASSRRNRRIEVFWRMGISCESQRDGRLDTKGVSNRSGPKVIAIEFY